jgi:hypothetical protein
MHQSMNRWFSESMNQWKNESMTQLPQWVNESMNEWINEWMSQWSVNQWTNELLSRWLSECMGFSESMTQWISQWMDKRMNFSELVNQWTNEWMNYIMDGLMYQCMGVLLRYLFTERPLRWGTTSLSDFFSERPLIWATSSLTLLWAASQAALRKLLQPNPSLCAAVSSLQLQSRKTGASQHHSCFIARSRANVFCRSRLQTRFCNLHFKITKTVMFGALLEDEVAKCAPDCIQWELDFT